MVVALGQGRANASSPTAPGCLGTQLPTGAIPTSTHKLPILPAVERAGISFTANVRKHLPFEVKVPFFLPRTPLVSCTAAPTTKLPRVGVLSLVLAGKTSRDCGPPTPKPAISPTPEHCPGDTAPTPTSPAGNGVGTDEPLCPSSCQRGLV